MKTFSVPRGTSDILPEEIPLWRELENTARHLFDIYGYKEIATPAFEERELFARSIGQSSDIVQKQMLGLASQNRSEESSAGNLVLRPEGTAAVVRAYIEHHLDKKEPLSKLCYIGPMFRGERPQKGRLRQFHQIGVEALGPDTSSPLLDAETIELCVTLLKDFGLEDFEVRINTLGTDDDKKRLSQTLRRQIKPHLPLLCDDCRDRFDRNVFRVLDCKNKSCRAVVDRLDLGDDYLSPESREYYSLLKENLKTLGIPFVESPRLVRGLDYYTHTVFEISAPSLGSQDALGAGGRYNNLVRQLGGPQVDAVGFALGMERILLARPPVSQREEVGLDAFIVALDQASLTEGFFILARLREQGVRSDISYQLSSLKSQMRLANKRQAAHVMILGADELKKGTVTLKDMRTGQQQEVPASRKEIARVLTILQEGRE